MRSVLNKVIKDAKDKDEGLKLIFNHYLEFRQKFIIKEVEDRLYFACEEYFNTFHFDYAKWSVLHFFLEKISKNEDIYKYKNIILKAYEDYFLEEDVFIEVIKYLHHCRFEISNYRSAACNIYDNDILFLTSDLDVYLTGDYLRLKLLERILVGSEV